MLLDSYGLSSKWLVVRLPWEEKIAKHHVEDGEDYNREERRHVYIDCHFLLQQYLSLQNQLSPTTRSIIK